MLKNMQSLSRVPLRGFQTSKSFSIQTSSSLPKTNSVLSIRLQPKSNSRSYSSHSKFEQQTTFSFKFNNGTKFSLNASTFRSNWKRNSNWEDFSGHRRFSSKNEKDSKNSTKSKEIPLTSIVLKALSVVGGAASLVATGWALLTAYYGYQSESWVETTAEIEDCYVTNWSGQTLGIEDFEYVFTVNGKEYHGYRYQIGQLFYPGEPVRQNASYLSFQPGKTIQIYYNPQNPEQATVVRGIDQLTKVVLPILIFVSGVAIKGATRNAFRLIR